VVQIQYSTGNGLDKTMQAICSLTLFIDAIIREKVTDCDFHYDLALPPYL